MANTKLVVFFDSCNRWLKSQKKLDIPNMKVESERMNMVIHHDGKKVLLMVSKKKKLDEDDIYKPFLEKTALV
jgi:hypothetical protein